MMFTKGVVMKASDLLVKALENEGVKYIFGVPGEENLDLVESLRNSSIKLIVTRHEQPAGFMAATYGRLTGKTGVCLSTLGPGATNLVTAAAYAQLAAMPMLMITGQKPIMKSKQGRFQIVDIVDMMRPLTKFSKQIVSANTIPCLIREAFRVAQQERPGAVHLELPEDIANEQTDADLFTVSPTQIPYADTDSIDKAVKMIEQARSPLLLFGAGVNRESLCSSPVLDDFITKTNIPFCNTQMGKGIIDERNPLYLGTAALSENDYVHCAINHADLIINVGHDIIEKPPFFMEADSAKVIHINFFPAHMDEVYFPTQEVVGDICNTMLQITDRITVQKHWDTDYYLNLKAKLDKHIYHGSDDTRFPILPKRIINDIREVMPSDGIITLDNGMYKIWFARNYPAHEANTILLDNALATMGAGLASAMGARFVYPNRKIIAICGDGGFMMNSQELETAIRHKLQLVILVLRDNSYGMIKWKQQDHGFADFGLDFGNPDFVKYAESYGANGYRVTKTEEFSPLLKACLDKPGVHLIEVPIDYSQDHKILGDVKKEVAKFK